MNVPPKSQWTVTAGSGDPSAASDDSYSTQWVAEPGTEPRLCIDLGQAATLAGLEVYWGLHGAEVYGFESSMDGQAWTPLCATRHGEGGQNVFAFPPVEARYVRWAPVDVPPEQPLEIVEINLYGPGEAATVLEPGRIAALGSGPVRLPAGESITVDLGYTRSPLGVLVQWGEDFGTDFSVHLSDDGKSFREVGRILQSNGDCDNFYWRTTTARFLRFTVLQATRPDGAIIEELKLRILNKDRMPIGHLERAAQAGRGDLYPQSLLNRQLYWTVLGEIDADEEALFDEFGNLEPRRCGPQFTPLLRLAGELHGAPASPGISHSLAEGSLPIPTVTWSAGAVVVQATALAIDGAALAEYLVTNRSDAPQQGALALALRPVQINPYWQHGGHAAISAISTDSMSVWVNDRPFAAFSREPDCVAITDFNEGDVVKLIEHGPRKTAFSARSASGLVSGAWEFAFDLAPGETASVLVSAPLRDGSPPEAEVDFAALRARAIATWRNKLGPRKITVGDPAIGDTVEAQIGLILANATRHAFKPGPRNYDRTWIRDGSSQALALAWAGLVEDAKRYVLWYAARIYANGLVPPILNPNGTVNQGYGSDIEFDAQGEFVAIAADTYRLCRDRTFLEAIFEPAVRATRYCEELVARTNEQHGPETRFFGLLAPSISHEGYNKPAYSYWDDFFALAAWRNLAYLAAEIGDAAVAAEAEAKGREFAANLARSMRLTAEHDGKGLVPASADRDDVDPASTSIAFEPLRVDDVLPADLVQPTYDRYSAHLDEVRAPDFKGAITPYEIRNLNAFVALGRYDDAFRLLEDALSWQRPPGWRAWAEVVWGELRAADYIGDMPHTWIGAEFATAIRRMLLRENGGTLELFRAVPDAWWAGEGIALRELPTAFGTANLTAWREGERVTVELSLSGPAPERVVVRYPGAKRAEADGRECVIEGDWVIAGGFGTLAISL
jgi:hypothetical protein